ncbi:MULTISPECIES: transposase [unclassified Nonomuraea]|uniref:transposase n=1 Tax=unclassified Nonomuraea TaxID=2593643 RepID=UPI00340704B0
MGASGCASPGCRRHGRKPSYPSDLTDAEWAVLEVEARAMMAELVAATGRPMVHDLRAVLDAIGYVARYGIEWRALPVDFPPHEAVYAFFLRWSGRGLPERLVGRLRGRLRIMAGRGELPTAGCIDSQMIRAAETVGAAVCGYDAGKRLKGQKRHIAVPPGLHQQDRTSPLRTHAHDHLSLCQQALRGVTIRRSRPRPGKPRRTPPGRR